MSHVYTPGVFDFGTTRDMYIREKREVTDFQLIKIVWLLPWKCATSQSVFLFISLSMDMGPTDEPPTKARNQGGTGKCPPPFLSPRWERQNRWMQKRETGKRGEKKGKGCKEEEKLDSVPPLTKKKKTRFLRPTYKEEKKSRFCALN